MNSFGFETVSVVVSYWFNFFNRYGPIQIILFFNKFWQIVSFKELIHLHFKICGLKFKVFFCYLGMYRDICFFISDINCVLLIFFIVSLARGLLILLIFPNNQLFGFADFFSVDFLSSISLISALIIIYSFSPAYSGLICPSLST